MKNLIKHLLVLVMIVGVAGFVSRKKEADIKSDIAPHVVSFNMLMLGNQRFATGFHLKYKGDVYIVTNQHVCNLHRMVYRHDHIQFKDYVGEIIAVDTEHDLCLVSSNREEGLSLAPAPAEVMDEVILVGHPRGLAKTIRKGYVTEYADHIFPWIKPYEIESFEISTICYGGNSGSPVVNKYGEVIGVLFAGPMAATPTEAQVVPLWALEDFLVRTLGE